MSLTWKVVFSVVGIVAIAGASAVWWTHNKQLIERKRLSDTATQVRARADHGDVTAEYKLAYMYYDGRGVPQDYAEASRWCRKAAEQGYAKAQFGLGDLYLHGKGAPQDFAEAARWTKRAADQGYPMAQDGLGYLYYNGVGVSQNYTEAFHWFSEAADQGNEEAEDALSYMYTNGVGVPKDYNRAAQWIQKAADQGDAEAQAALGSMYANGMGVPQNRTEAYRWFRKAADQGDIKAKHSLELLRSQSMTKMRWLELFTDFAAIPLGLWASLEFLLPGRMFKNRRQAAVTLLGICFLSIAGLDLYAFTHYDMQCSPHQYAYHVARYIFITIVVLIIVTVVLPGRWQVARSSSAKNDPER
jgi:TPR repeat protein